MRLFRSELPQQGIAFVVMSRDESMLADGQPFDFDALYRTVTAPTITECGMTPERSDQIFGTAGTLNSLWSGIQHAEVVVIDFSSRPAESVMALGLALALGKRLVVLAQRATDIPTDLRDLSRVILYDPAGMGVATLMQELKNRIRQIRQEVVTENKFAPLEGAATRPVRGTVVGVDKDAVMVETVEDDARVTRTLGNGDVDYSRMVSVMSRLFRVGDQLDGAVTTGLDGVERYTLLADQVNPWPGIVSAFPVGHVFTGRVSNVREGIGAFVSVTEDINGFVPYAEARQAHLVRDMDVTVEVLSVSIDTRKIALRLRSAPTEPPRTGDELVLPHTGEQLVGRVIQAVPERRNRGGGFLLLRLSGYEQGPLAMLHCTRMTSQLRAELNAADETTSLDRLIWVEVIHTDPERNRIQLAPLHRTAESSVA